MILSSMVSAEHIGRVCELHDEQVNRLGVECDIIRDCTWIGIARYTLRGAAAQSPSAAFGQQVRFVIRQQNKEV